MGHYDDYYENDRQMSIKRQERENREEMLEKISQANNEDIEFLLFVCENIKDIKAHFRIIGIIKNNI